MPIRYSRAPSSYTRSSAEERLRDLIARHIDELTREMPPPLVAKLTDMVSSCVIATSSHRVHLMDAENFLRDVLLCWERGEALAESPWMKMYPTRITKVTTNE